jgi:hypothetical protein
MRKSRPNRLGWLCTIVLGCAGFLAACENDLVEPVSEAGSVELAPASTTNHTMAMDIAGPVDLGSETATIKTTEVAGPIEDARGAVHAAMSRRHGIASDQHHRLVTASTSHQKSPRQVAARQAPARKQAKVSAETRAAGPKT